MIFKVLEERYQIEVLLVDEYDEISDILKEINYFTNQKNVFISGSYKHYNEDKLVEIDNLCKKLTQTPY